MKKGTIRIYRDANNRLRWSLDARKKMVNVYDETKKLLNTFLPFPNEDPIHFMSPDEVVAIDFGGIIKRTTAGKIAEAVANHNKPGILGRLDPEKVLTDDVKAKIKSSFDNILFSPNKEPVDLPPYQQPASYTFELKPTDVFNITVDGRELNMSGQTLKEALEARIEKDDRDEFNHARQWKTPDPVNKPKVHLVEWNESVRILPQEGISFEIKASEIIDAVAVKDQVENLRQEAEALTQWKNGALDVLKRWNDVQDYITKKGDFKMWGKNVSEIVLQELIQLQKLREERAATSTMTAINAREYTPEEAVTEFLERLQGHENQYPWILETINSRLIGHLQKIAEQSRETSDIARKRFEESIIILQKVSPQKH